MRFRKKLVVVDAVKLDKGGFYPTHQGRQNADPGDWLITNEDGQQFLWQDKYFQETYEPVVAGGPSESSVARSKILTEIAEEEEDRYDLWNERKRGLPYRFCILVQEMGEVACHLLTGDRRAVRQWLLQAGAVIVAMIEYIDKMGDVFRPIFYPMEGREDEVSQEEHGGDGVPGHCRESNGACSH